MFFLGRLAILSIFIARVLDASVAEGPAFLLSQVQAEEREARLAEAQVLAFAARKARLEAALEEATAETERDQGKAARDIASFLRKPANEFALISGAAGVFSLALTFALIRDKWSAEKDSLRKRRKNITFRAYLAQRLFGTFDIQEPATIAKILAAISFAVCLTQLLGESEKN